MGNNQPEQKPDDKTADNLLGKEHINQHGKKGSTSNIFLEPDEDNTLQTPEEFAKDKGKVAGEEEK